MDIREYNGFKGQEGFKGRNTNRHPWELSRSVSLVAEIEPFVRKLGRDGTPLRFADIGPGDLYIDRLHMRAFPKHILYAVDIGYPDSRQIRDNIYLYRDISEIDRNDLDYVFMMDCLELMEDDLSYLRVLSSKTRPGGYLFFTVPAFRFMFSEHDEHVENLHRYSIKDFEKLVTRAGGLKIVRQHYFYTSLFLVRLTQKLLRIPVDPEQKITTAWHLNKKHFLTRLCVAMLNCDYRIHRALDRYGVHPPGLSLFVICQKL